MSLLAILVKSCYNYCMKSPRTTIKKHQKQLIFGLFLLLCGLGIWWYLYPRGDTLVISSSDSSTEKKIYRLIDGIEAQTTTSTLVGVIIDNSPESWPQFGITDAQMVYEVPVEGGRTRLVAVFDLASLNDATKIGPVRSVRDVFLDISRELYFTPVHVGGSPGALARVDAGEIKTLNQFFRDPYFYRTKEGGRYAPHNVLTTGALLKKAAEKYNFKIADISSWQFEDGKSKGGATMTPKIDFGEIKVTWKYDPATNNYTRFVNGKEFKDASGASVTAKNMIDMKTNMRIIDEKLRRDVRMMGRGKAVVYKNGETIVATWKRSILGERTTFYDENAKELSFVRGITWVEVTQKD